MLIVKYKIITAFSGAPTITDLYCLLWYANATVEETKVFEYSKVYYVNTNHTDPAFLLNCPARRGDVPVAVSVVSLRDYDDYCKMPRNFVTVRHSTPGVTFNISLIISHTKKCAVLQSFV